MKVGDLVRSKDKYSPDTDWIGIVIDFHTVVDAYGEPVDRYAVVCWNTKFPQEEEYLDSLEVING